MFMRMSPMQSLYINLPKAFELRQKGADGFIFMFGVTVGIFYKPPYKLFNFLQLGEVSPIDLITPEGITMKRVLEKNQQDKVQEAYYARFDRVYQSKEASKIFRI